MRLGRVHTRESCCRLLEQHSVGQHARRVPHACAKTLHEDCSKLSCLCTVAPMHECSHPARLSTLPLEQSVLGHHAAARGNGNCAYPTLREPPRREETYPTGTTGNEVIAARGRRVDFYSLNGASQPGYQMRVAAHHRLVLYK